MTTYANLTDLHLAALLKQDDERAFAEIYSRYAASLATFVTGRLFDIDEARDLIHDLFLKLWQGRTQLKLEKCFKTYLFAAARYRLVDHIRRNLTREHYANMAKKLAEACEAAVEQEIAVKELRTQIELSLLKLPPRTREIYLLSREAHRSIPEIAQELRLSEQTVKNQLSTALKHLRQSLMHLPLPLLLIICAS